MKRTTFWLKAAGAAVLIAALGATASLVALKALFPEPKLRAMAVDAARKQLGREVRLQGIGVGLRGLTLTGLEVSELPNFAAGTFLKVDSFRLRPSWKALLKRKLVVAAVSADGLAVKVIKGTDGRFNFETLASSAPAPTPAAKPADAPAAELDVRLARVTRATVEYADRSTGADWKVGGLSAEVSDFDQDGPFGASLSGRIVGKAGERPVDAEVSFAGTIDLAHGDKPKFKAELKKFSVEQGDLRLRGSLKIAGLVTPRVSFDVNLAASGKTVLEATGAAGVGDGVEVVGQAKTPGLDTRVLAKLVAGVPALNLPASDLALSGRFAADAAEVRSFKAAWAGGKIEGSGTAKALGTAKPVYEGRAAFGLDVPEIKPGEYPFLKLPPKLTVPAGRLDGEVAITGDDLKITSLKVMTKAGTVSASGVIRRATSAKPAPEIVATFGLDLPAFKVSDLPVAVTALPPSLLVPAARLDGGVRVTGDDLRLDKVVVKARGSTIRLDGTVAKALAGAPVPAVDLSADLNLPPLTDKDVPFAGVPAGLQLPASRWLVEASYAPQAIKIRSFRATIGKNDVEVTGTVTDPAGRGAFDLLVKCRSFVLDELTQATPKTRDLKLGGSGFFALSVTGKKDKPVYAGKLQFKGLGATVAGLPLADFTGTVSFDERRIDVPNLVGKVADGSLKMDLTVRDYSRSPEIQLEADLDRFDLGRYLAAKNKVAADRAAAKAAKPGAAAEKPTPFATRGHFNVGSLSHPNATVEAVKVSWDLRGVTADLRGLGGDAKLHVGGGRVHSMGELATQSKLVKVLIFPLLIVQKLGRIGGIRLFPDFNDIALNQIVGDYGFKDGVMTLRESEMDSDAARVSARGTIDLPAELLDLVVTAQVANVAPIEVAVTGGVDNPKTKVNLGKFIKQLIPGLKEE